MQPWHGAGDPSLGHRAALGLHPSGIGIGRRHGCPSDTHLSGEQAAVLVLGFFCMGFGAQLAPLLGFQQP